MGSRRHWRNRRPGRHFRGRLPGQRAQDRRPGWRGPGSPLCRPLGGHRGRPVLLRGWYGRGLRRRNGKLRGCWLAVARSNCSPSSSEPAQSSLGRWGSLLWCSMASSSPWACAFRSRKKNEGSTSSSTASMPTRTSDLPARASSAHLPAAKPIQAETLPARAAREYIPRKYSERT